MKKCEIIKKSSDFNRIISNKKGLRSKLFIINYEYNDNNIAQFGITISKKNANAVIRNKMKRRIKSIIDNNKNMYEKNKNYIIIIKKEAIFEKYEDLEKELITMFSKLNGGKNEK